MEDDEKDEMLKAQEHIMAERKEEILKVVKAQINKLEEIKKNEGYAKCCCRWLGRIVLGLIILGFIANFIRNTYKNRQQDLMQREQ